VSQPLGHALLVQRVLSESARREDRIEALASLAEDSAAVLEHLEELDALLPQLQGDDEFRVALLDVFLQVIDPENPTKDRCKTFLTLPAFLEHLVALLQLNSSTKLRAVQILSALLRGSASPESIQNALVSLPLAINDICSLLADRLELVWMGMLSGFLD